MFSKTRLRFDRLRLDGTLITPSQPAIPGETVAFYVTGLNITGPVTPPYQFNLPGSMEMQIGGYACPVVSAAPFSPGVFQVVVQIPAGMGPGEYNLIFSAGSFPSQQWMILPVGATQ